LSDQEYFTAQSENYSQIASDQDYSSEILMTDVEVLVDVDESEIQKSDEEVV